MRAATRLSLDPSPTSARDSDAGARPGQSRRGRLLFADDDEAMRTWLFDALTDAGYEVDLAASGVDALRTLRGRRPDILILDLLMPAKSGWQVWDEVQMDAALRAIPIVVYTGTGLNSGALGPAPIVSKSAPLKDLLNVIDEVLSRRRPD